MTPLLVFTLVAHVILGIVGIGFLFLSFMQLLRHAPPYRRVVWYASAAVTTLLLSWFSSAYYYVSYYGKSVKPKIVGGAYPWAHGIFMEAKEHVFIILPFLAITLLLAAIVLRNTPSDTLRRGAAALACVAVVLGAFVAASGILVSGAVR